MPKRALTPCRGRCGALVESGYCAACKSDSLGTAGPRKTATQRGYDAQWRRTRTAYFAVHPFCADPYGLHGEVLVLASDLDHITPHRCNRQLFLDPANRQGLCRSCHSKKTALEDGGFGR